MLFFACCSPCGCSSFVAPFFLGTFGPACYCYCSFVAPPMPAPCLIVDIFGLCFFGQYSLHPIFFASNFWSYNQQAKAKEGEFFLEMFFTFYLIIFKSFSLVSQIFIQCDAIYFCFDFS